MYGWVRPSVPASWTEHDDKAAKDGRICKMRDDVNRMGSASKSNFENSEDK